ncbi:hypothetical protein VQ045_14810 [Aurantimonas sp. E1-2-R+4]|uniref:hypothetical protein n=1 Tax=Aurantimonas sp. E1-2-R+4 TaxID=3113714 RepID=UPI002F92F59C
MQAAVEFDGEGNLTIGLPHNDRNDPAFPKADRLMTISTCSFGRPCSNRHFGWAAFGRISFLVLFLSLNAGQFAEAAPSPIPDSPSLALRSNGHVAPGGTSAKKAPGSSAEQRLALTPPNPDRPFRARTCVEALTRLREAARGSPLIDPQENQAVLMKAIDQAIAVCSKEICRKRN